MIVCLDTNVVIYLIEKTPLWEAKAKPPDPAKVKVAYDAYLEKLKLAD